MSHNRTVIIPDEEFDQFQEELNDENTDPSISSAFDQVYLELGKAIYENYYENPTPQLLTYFDKITWLKQLKPQDFLTPKKDTISIQEQPFESVPEKEEDIDFLEELAMKNEKEHPYPKKMPEIRPSASSKPEIPKVPKKTKICPNCQATVSVDYLFCDQCGTRLE